MSFTALVLAGSRPQGDPLARRFGTDMKALIPISGEPMVCRPVRALLGSGQIDQLILASQVPERLKTEIPTDGRIRFRKSRSTIAETLIELVEDRTITWPLLVTTADNVLLDTDTLDQFTGCGGGAEIAIGVVEKANLLARLPETKRTWLSFRGGAYTGANLFILGSPKVRPAIELWRSVEQDRKKAWRVLSLLGPASLLGILLRLVSLDQVMARLSDRLGVPMNAVRLSNPLVGVDVDTSDDHALVEKILRGEA